MKRLSIKWRVTLWFTGLMLLLTAAALAFLLAAGERMTTAGAQAALSDAVTDSFREIEYDDGALEFDSDLRYLSDGAFLSVYDLDGRILYGRLPAAALAQMSFEDSQTRTAEADGVKWYVYDALLDVEGKTTVWVRGVSSANTAEAPFGTLIRLALLGLPFISLLAAGGGYLLVDRAFLPVRRITRTAEEIGSGTDLSKRIALGEGKDELYALAATFDRMLDRLQASFENEKRFVSDASHELRTPMAVILTQCEESLQTVQTLEEAKAALGNVLEQTRRMSNLISQLLTLSRTDKAHVKLQPEAVNLSELTELVAAQIKEAASEKGIAVHTEIQPGIVVSGDETLLMRLLLNLMENAVKYGKPGGKVTARLWREGEEAVGEIEDDGIGISPQQLPLIWERFYRSDEARSTAESGLGLGLPMVRYIVQAHGGTVEAESQPGQGSIFRFRLPVENK